MSFVLIEEKKEEKIRETLNPLKVCGYSTDIKNYLEIQVKGKNL